MGIFSGILGRIGTMLGGPIGGAIGSGIGSLVQGSKEKKAAQQARNDEINATNASIEQTNAWRLENRLWDQADAHEDRLFADKQWTNQTAFAVQMRDQERAYNDPAALRARAEAAGFNPLALLGTGVGMGSGAPSAPSVPYGGSSNSVGVSIAPAADLAAHPVASSDLSLLGEAFGSGMQEYSTAVSEATQLRQHNQALKEELAKAVVRPSVGGIYGGGDVPVQMIASNKYGSTSKAPVVDKDAEAASNKGYATGDKAGTLMGIPLETTGWNSDGAWFTDKYGEPAEWLVALPSLTSDLGYSVGRKLGRWKDKFDADNRGIGPTMKIGGKTFKMEGPSKVKPPKGAVSGYQPNAARGQKLYPHEILKNRKYGS